MKTVNGEVSRQQILSAAQALFIQHGYAGTSVRAIAEHAGGQTVANLYNYFSGKEAIFAALIEENTTLSAFTIQLETLPQGNYAEFTTNLMQILLPHFNTHAEYLELLMIDVREFNGKHLSAALAALKPVILQLVDQLESLSDSQNYHAVIMLRLLASLIIGYIFTDKVAPERMRSQFSELVWKDQVIRFWSAGVAGLCSTNTSVPA